MKNDDEHEAAGCDNPDCPVHGKNGFVEHLKAQGFKILTGKGNASLAAVLASVFGNKVKTNDDQREKIQDRLTAVIGTVLKMQAQQHPDDEPDLYSQALMQALGQLLASTAAEYALDFVHKEHGLEGQEWNELKALAAGHINSMVESIARHTTSVMLLTLAIDRKARGAIEQAEQARKEAENN